MCLYSSGIEWLWMDSQFSLFFLSFSLVLIWEHESKTECIISIFVISIDKQICTHRHTHKQRHPSKADEGKTTVCETINGKTWKTKYLSLQFHNDYEMNYVFLLYCTAIQTRLFDSRRFQSVWSGKSILHDSTTHSLILYLSILFWSGMQHQSITCNSHCMHVKEQNENWHLLVIWIFLYCFFFPFSALCSLFRRYFREVTLCVLSLQVRLRGLRDQQPYYICWTSFLLISISLETTSSLMCQFPYFHARITWQIKIDRKLQFNICLISCHIYRQSYRTKFSYTLNRSGFIIIQKCVFIEELKPSFEYQQISIVSCMCVLLSRNRKRFASFSFIIINSLDSLEILVK